MLHVFSFAANALLPLILEILLGIFLHAKHFLNEEFFLGARKFAFYIAIPASIFCSIYSTKSIFDANWGVVAFVFIAVLVLFGIGVLCALLFFKDDRKKGVIIQCTYRSNFNIIAVPMAQALGGAAGLTTVAFLTATTIPQFNILAVIALTLFVRDSQAYSVGKVIRDILKNPMIIACFCGITCLILRCFIPLDPQGQLKFSLSGSVPFLYTTIEAIGKTATPLALITLGGLFNLKALKGRSKELLIGTLLRLLLAPALVLSSAYLLSRLGILSLSTAEYACFVAIFASPVATVSGVMAAQMGSDDVFADQLVIITTLVSSFTVFAFVCILRANGLL